MDTQSAVMQREAAVSLLACFGVSATAILAYVAVWKWTPPGLSLFLILGTYLSLVGFSLLQAFRVARMDSWVRRLGAVGVVVGLTATIFLGLRPRPACLDVGPCPNGLTLHPLQFALGILIASVSLFLDVRNRANPLAD